MGVAAFSRHGTPWERRSIFRLYELYLGLHFSVSQSNTMLTALLNTCLDPLTAHSWLLQHAALLILLPPFWTAIFPAAPLLSSHLIIGTSCHAWFKNPAYTKTLAHFCIATCKSAVRLAIHYHGQAKVFRKWRGKLSKIPLQCWDPVCTLAEAQCFVFLWKRLLEKQLFFLQNKSLWSTRATKCAQVQQHWLPTVPQLMSSGQMQQILAMHYHTKTRGLAMHRIIVQLF